MLAEGDLVLIDDDIGDGDAADIPGPIVTTFRSTLLSGTDQANPVVLMDEMDPIQVYAPKSVRILSKAIDTSIPLPRFPGVVGKCLATPLSCPIPVATSVGLDCDNMGPLFGKMRATAAMELVKVLLLDSVVCSDALIAVRTLLHYGVIRVLHVVSSSAAPSSASKASSYVSPLKNATSNGSVGASPSSSTSSASTQVCLSATAVRERAKLAAGFNFARITSATRVTFTLRGGGQGSLNNKAMIDPYGANAGAPKNLATAPSNTVDSAPLVEGGTISSLQAAANIDCQEEAVGGTAVDIPSSTRAAWLALVQPAAPSASSKKLVFGCDASRNQFLEMALLPLVYKSFPPSSFEWSITSTRGIGLVGAAPPTPLDLPRGLLLYGPPGVGKTALVKDVAAEVSRRLVGSRVRVFSVAGPSLLSAQVGEGEARLRGLFREAHEFAYGEGGEGNSDVSSSSSSSSSLPSSSSSSLPSSTSSSLPSSLSSSLPSSSSSSSPASSSSSSPSPSSESETVREGVQLFQSCRLSIIFFDEIDALCAARQRDGRESSGSSSSSASRLVTQLLTLMDGAKEPSTSFPWVSSSSSSFSTARKDAGTYVGLVLIVGATNRPDALDPAFRRPGRFDREVRLEPPSISSRLEILRAKIFPDVSSASLTTLSSPNLLQDVAQRCVGFVGADLEALVREATLHADWKHSAAAAEKEAAGSSRNYATDASFVARHLDADDFRAALRLVVPASLRDFDAAVPMQSDEETSSTKDLQVMSNAATASSSGAVECLVVKGDDIHASIKTAAAMKPTQAVEEGPWSGIGGMDEVISRLTSTVVFPFKHAQAFQKFAIAPPRGLLLHGPPGNSKTSLARALARALGSSFFALSGADIYSAYVGESERALRAIFSKARAAAPALIFFDELDALVGSREGGHSGGGGGAAASVSLGILATLLTEMDGLGSAEGLLVVGATNRLDQIDPALLRPGRLELHLRVPQPTREGRSTILRIHCRGKPLSADVELGALAGATEGWSGAELGNLCQEAALEAVREDLEGARSISQRHFVRAAERLRAAIRSSPRV